MRMNGDLRPGDVLEVRLSFTVSVDECSLGMLFFGAQLIITAVTHGSAASINVSALVLNRDGTVHSVEWEHGAVPRAMTRMLARV